MLTPGITAPLGSEICPRTVAVAMGVTTAGVVVVAAVGAFCARTVLVNATHSIKLNNEAFEKPMNSSIFECNYPSLVLISL